MNTPAVLAAHGGREEGLHRQSLDADTLQSMRTAFETAERMAPTHPHPPGPESALGNMLVGRFVAVVDKVRDALRSEKSS